MKTIYLALSLSMMLAACQPWNRHGEKTVFTGRFAMHGEATVRLSLYSPGGLKVIDSCTADGSGCFKLDIRASFPDVYRLSVASNNFTDIIVMPGNRVRIVAEGISIRSPLTVTGSLESDTLLAFDRLLLDAERRLDSIRDQAVLEPEPALSNYLLNGSIQLREKLKADFMDTVDAYAKKNPGSFLPLILMTKIFDDESLFRLDRDLEHIMLQIGTNEEKFHCSSFFRFAEFQARKFCSDKILWEMAGDALQPGMIMPAIEMTTLGGSPSVLFEPPARLMLVWFWQSGCSHCRDESEALQALYDLYHPAGFEIFTIALDEDPGKAQNTILEWKIPWSVSVPLPGERDMIIHTYNISGTPSSFLLDQNRAIVMRDPSVESLKSSLLKLMPV